MADTKKYLDLEGLQAFYDHLSGKLVSGDFAYADSALNLNSEKPIQNKVISQYLAMNQNDINSLSSYASSGYAASAWVQSHFSGYLDDDWTYSGDQKTISEALNDLNSRLDSVEITVNNTPTASPTASYETLTAFSAYLSSVSANSISATSATVLTATGDSAQFTNISSTNLTSTNANITNLTSTNISSTNLTALTANGNSAKYTNISSTFINTDHISANTITSTYISATNVTADTFSGNLSGLAGSATKLSSARDISITGDEIGWSVSFDGSQNVAASGQIKNVKWSALSSNAVGSASTSTTGIMTPNQIQAAIEDKVKTAIGGVYQVKGNASWSELTGTSTSASHCQNGYVYNITGTTTTADKDRYGHEVHVGDNVVYVSASDGSIPAGWDVLANTTEMTGKLDTTAFTAWSASTASNFSGLSNSAVTVTGYVGSQTVANVIGSANSGKNAYNWLTANSKNLVSAVTTATGTNVDLSAKFTTAASGATVTLQATGYKTTLTTGTYISGTSADSNHTFNYNLTKTATDYLEEGHSAWSSVSSLINGDVISARIVKASDGFSGINISGSSKTATIDGLIGSAQSGKAASAWIANTANYYYSGNFVPYTTAEVVTGINW